MRNAIIIAGGDPPDPSVREDLPETDLFVVGADSGADHARELGLELDVIVGDLDSIDPTTLDQHPTAQVITYPADKDATDLELALDMIADRDDIDRLLVLGGTGGRLDHFLATALILAAPRFDTLDIEWLAHPGRVTVIHRHASLHGSVGSKVSLLPVGGDARGVRTVGLTWQLERETLPFGTSRGVSNEFAAAMADVSLESGVLLAVQPVD
jgi:thiamine pyrophosphokinase